MFDSSTTEEVTGFFIQGTMEEFIDGSLIWFWERLSDHITHRCYNMGVEPRGILRGRECSRDDEVVIVLWELELEQ